jgi:hypothetical protein
MGKALLVNIDLMVRIVVPDNATEDQIIAAAVNKALLNAGDRDTQRSWFGEGVSEWRDDEEMPFDPETESDDGRHIIGYQIESNDDEHTTPRDLWSFEIFLQKEEAAAYMTENNLDAALWRIITIFDGDIEGPTYVGEPITE